MNTNTIYVNDLVDDVWAQNAASIRESIEDQIVEKGYKPGDESMLEDDFIWDIQDLVEDVHAAILDEAWGVEDEIRTRISDLVYQLLDDPNADGDGLDD